MKPFGTFSLEESLKGVMARGYIPWAIGELKKVYEISLNKQYIHQSGPKKGKPNIKIITEEINRIFHHSSRVRTYEAVSQALKRYKKKLNCLDF